jgi:hypothetical protein
MAVTGTTLALAGAPRYVLPGPGLAVLVIGLAGLVTGLVMIAITRRS